MVAIRMEAAVQVAVTMATVHTVVAAGVRRCLAALVVDLLEIPEEVVAVAPEVVAMMIYREFSDYHSRRIKTLHHLPFQLYQHLHSIVDGWHQLGKP